MMGDCSKIYEHGAWGLPTILRMNFLVLQTNGAVCNRLYDDERLLVNFRGIL